MTKTNFNDLVESGKNSPRPILLKDIEGLIKSSYFRLYKYLTLDGKLFASLLHYSELFSPQFVAKLEDRIADLVE